MMLFPYAHATHPQWQMAAALVLAQLRAQMAQPDYCPAPTLGLLYITDHFADAAQDLLEFLQAELPLVTDWSGTVGVGIAANNVEYWDEPALALMLLELPVDQYRVFSGVAPLGLGFEAHAALVHADPETADLPELIGEMAQRTHSGYLFGGLSASRTRRVQFAVGGSGNISGHGGASGVFTGGLSGVAFGEGVSLVSRITQGCMPVAPVRRVSEADGNVVLSLDGEPALDVLLRDLSISLDEPQTAMAVVGSTLVGLMPAQAVRRHHAADGSRAAEPGDPVPRNALLQHSGSFGDDVLVRHIVGLDPGRRAVAVAAHVDAGTEMAFCQRNVQASRMDITRMCAEIRDAVESAVAPAMHIAGAVYVSCTGRGGPHFGSDSAELQIVRRALGDVPLVGFFAGGEIARHHLYGYTGVLTVFTVSA
jgi:small ligand-binding sensory domain FIST